MRIPLISTLVRVCRSASFPRAIPDAGSVPLSDDLTVERLILGRAGDRSMRRFEHRKVLGSQMKRYRNCHRRLYFAFGLYLATVLSAQAIDELWERTEQFVRESAVWLPGKVETHQHVVDGKGKQLSENVMCLTIAQDAKSKGCLRGRLEQRLENGEDLTEASRAEVEAEFQKQLEKVTFDMPFHLDRPSQAISGLRENRKTIGEVECIGYEFQVTETPDPDQPALRFEGVVWVDPITAVPLRIESNLLDLPRKQDDAEIVSLVLQRSYDTLEGAWVPIQEQQETWLNARFFFKTVVIHVAGTTEYHEHWKWKQHW